MRRDASRSCGPYRETALFTFCDDRLRLTEKYQSRFLESYGMIHGPARRIKFARGQKRALTGYRSEPRIYDSVYRVARQEKLPNDSEQINCCLNSSARTLVFMAVRVIYACIGKNLRTYVFWLRSCCGQSEESEGCKRGCTIA